MRTVLMIALSVAFAICAKAQSPHSAGEYMEIGKVCPDFNIRQIENYQTREVSVKSLRGKWVYLDFWDKRCTGCIASFPKVDALKRQLSETVDFFLIGREDSEGEAKAIYRQIFKKLKMSIPCAFDSLLFKRLDILEGPYIVVIDPNGIVRTITYQLTKENLTDLIAGKKIEAPRAYREHESKEETKAAFDNQKLFLINGNGGADTAFLYRSVLSEWNPAIGRAGYYPVNVAPASKNGTLQMIGASLSTMFFEAYLGMDVPGGRDPEKPQSIERKYQSDEFFPRQILKVKDSTLFISDAKSQKNLYCYSMKIPKQKATVANVMSHMQRDLANYFNFSASVERRELPYWKLTASNKAKKRYIAKGDSTEKKYTKMGIRLRNRPVREILRFSHAPDGLPLGDGTEITENIDIDLDFAPISFEDFRRELHEKGFDLVKSTKMMKCLVIRDIP